LSVLEKVVWPELVSVQDRAVVLVARVLGGPDRMVVLGHVDLGVIEIPLAVAGIRNTVASSAIVSHELAYPRLGLLVKGIKVAPVDMRRRSVLFEDSLVAEPEAAGGVLL
jgi:hypothetical protein